MANPWWWKRLHPLAIWNGTRILNEVGGLRVTSGWRSRLANRRVNGSPRSLHLQGRAVDFVGPMVMMERARRFALELGASKAIIHDAGSGLHLHTEWTD